MRTSEISLLSSAFRRIGILTAALAFPASAHAVNYVRSVEYVEVNLADGVLTASTNLTKGQNLANCVPFATAMSTGAVNRYGRRLTDVFFEASPSRVTVQRDFGTASTVSVGVYVVEFDPAFVNVFQGTFTNGLAAAQPTTTPIAGVTLAKAALVFYYRYSNESSNTEFDDVAVAGWFAPNTQLNWQRAQATEGAINGHYYVFEARNAEFSVQPLSFNMAASAVGTTAPIPTPVDPDKTLVIASYWTTYPDEDTEDGHFRVSLSNATTLGVSRTWGGGSGINAIADIRAFVVQLGGDVRVQRGTVSYADTDTQKTAAVEAVNLASAMVWNGLGFGPGAFEHGGVDSDDTDGAHQRLKLASASTVQSDRGDGVCNGTALDCNGFGPFEVVDFDPPGQMFVKSGKYTGNNTDGKLVHVGFQPDVVLVKRAGVDPQAYAVLRTSSMTGDQTKSLQDSGPTALAPDLIQSFVATGFTVGQDTAVNAAGTEYHWVAFRAAAGELKVDSYLGDGGANQSISDVGFQPEYLMVLPPGSGTNGMPVSTVSTFAADSASDFDATTRPDTIQALEPGGFRVGNGGASEPNLNLNGIQYHYVAWNAVPGRMAVGTYQGNGVNDRNLDVVGFFPEVVMVKQSPPVTSEPWVFKPASTGVTADVSFRFNDIPFVPPLTNSIEELRRLGFQVGNDPRVNAAAGACGGSDCTYHYVAFGPHLPVVNYRSIGSPTKPDYGTGAAAGATTRVNVTNGSPTLSGVGGTTWQSANRGRGDVITMPCDDPPACTAPSAGVHYQILRVDSNGQLLLRDAYAGPTAANVSYVIRRQFTTLQAWENCISFNSDDGGGSDACTYFDVASGSLVADDRSEIGIAYNDVLEPTADFDTPVLINSDVGATTDPTHTITLTADPGNRHHGIPGAGVRVTCPAGNSAVRIKDDYVTVEWLEFASTTAPGAISVLEISPGSGTTAASRLVIRNNLIHGAAGSNQGIILQDGDEAADVYNNIVYSLATHIRVVSSALAPWAQIRILNNTMFDYGISAFDSSVDAGSNSENVLLVNNIAADVASGTSYVPDGPINPASRNNVSDDARAGTGAGNVSPGGGGIINVGISDNPGVCSAGPVMPTSGGCVYFQSCTGGPVNCTGGAFNLHLRSSVAANRAVDTGADFSSLFAGDIDAGLRQTPWDRGADDMAATTAVKLQSFGARGLDSAVEVSWQTASELDNLGFHLYRSLGENGPWTRLTTSLIPGLGSSAVGQRYTFRDAGLVNGTRYFYRLEDVDASSKTTSHGPVSAVPTAGTSADRGGKKDAGDKKKGSASSSCPDWVLSAYASAVGSDAAIASLRCTRHGDPEAVSLETLSRDSRQATLELRTAGFYALHEPAGTVRVFVPGFDFPQDEKSAALPIRRALTDAVVGRRVQLAGVRALDLVSFKGLVPSSLGKAEMQVGWDGTVRAARRGTRTQARQFPRSELVSVLPSLFQGEQKSAVVEIAPLRFDAQRQQLVLAKRVRVRLLFTGREVGESGRGSVGRAQGPKTPVVAGEILGRLYTTSRGLHSVSFEQLFPGQSRGLSASQLRLERQGEPVGFHLEPSADSFGPGSRLYFYADKAAGSTEFSGEVAYELVRSAGGVTMPLQSAAPGSNALLSASLVSRSFETNRLYQPGLLDAVDPWLWEPLVSGVTRVKSFTLTGVSGSGEAELEVYVQGASESGQPVDHHLSVSLNGTLVGEAQFAGKKPYRMSLSLPASLLREGANDFSLTNVGDTGVTSLVFFDRFTLAHPQASLLAGGRFEGTWSESGSATVSGLTGPAALVDVTAAPQWLTGYQASGGGVSFQAAAGHRYLVASQEALLAPRVAAREASTLRATTNQADYILVTPKAFLLAAEPLVQRRADQGLTTRVVTLEEIASEFGHGQPSAEAIKGFLAYAYHSWTRPSPRYVLLLGDASYDPRNFIGSSQPAPLPALWTKTSYLWTVSDPQLAAVNGEDTLPDLAIGRLPAATVEQAEALVAKLLAWEDSGQGLSGPAALVADNPDIAGDFEADVQDVASSFLAGRHQLLRLSELGAGMRPAILDALNSGLSYLSYVGHGGAAVWASENVWNSWDAPSLLAQSQQPLLVTMNCLNGYFVAPSFESLSESLLKVEGRGAFASFSPSGLSLDGPAHQYHLALMAALTSEQHARLGDAVLAAQKAYAETGLMPELLGVYHFFGDPATPIR